MPSKTAQFALCLLLSVALPRVACGGNIDPHDANLQHAWGENIGWLSFDPNRSDPNVGATVTETNISGFIWAENVGWINLDPNADDPNTGIKNDGSGQLSGYAWGENVGWIDFNPTVAGDPNHLGVTIDECGYFSGYAWGENIGWISFNNEQRVRACRICYEDFADLISHWLGSGQKGEITNFDDFASLASFWKNYCGGETDNPVVCS